MGVSSLTLDEAELKKRYLKLAKELHPDAEKGSDEAFKKLQDAYARLKAEAQGFNYTEEDLFNIYKQQKDEQEKAAERSSRLYLYARMFRNRTAAVSALLSKSLSGYSRHLDRGRLHRCRGHK